MTKISTAEKLIKLSFILLAFTPFIIIHGTFFPFMFGKSVFIKLMIGVSGVLFAIGVLGKKNPPRLKPGRFKNPLVIAYIVFFSLAVISTLLSVNPYRALWGTEERSEGLLILIYMLLFFFGSLLFFGQKDWLDFFKTNLLVGGVISADILIEWLGGTNRPDGSFLDNSAVAAVYCLFVLFFALIVGILDKSRGWRYTSGGIGIAATAAILATGTRAVTVGLIVAVFVVLLRLAFVGDLRVRLRLSKKVIDVRKLSAVLLLLIAVFSAVFISTRSNPIWQGVPGLDRLAKISTADPATQARLVNIGISLNAVNPANVSIVRTLFGWGPDNYVNAHNQFYDPSIQRFETEWFDRAHNKILDVFVMNGIIGLAAYLCIWVIVLWKAFRLRIEKDRERSSEELWLSLTIGGVATAYFVQSLFFFDPIAAYVSIFSLLSFSAYTYYVRDKELGDENVRSGGVSLPVKLGSTVLGVLLVASFVWTAAIPIYQMKTATGRLKQGSFDAEDIRRATTPDTFIQAEVRPIVLFSALEILPKDDIADILPQMLQFGEEALEKTDNKARREHEMGLFYNKVFKLFGGEEYLVRGEEHLKKAVALAPGRQNTVFVLVENLTLQGKFDEIRPIMDAARAAEPDGALIDVFYLSYLAPIDFDGRLGTLEQLKNFYLGDGGVGDNAETRYAIDNYSNVITYARPTVGGGSLRVINDIEILFIRESYSNYISYAYRTKDEVLFRRIILQTIEIEKTLREIIDFQAKNGIIEKSVDTREETFMQALNILDTYGLDAINLK